MKTDGENPGEKLTYLQKKSKVFRPTMRLSLAALAGFLLLAGVLFLAGFNEVLELTNTEVVLCLMPHDAG